MTTYRIFSMDLTKIFFYRNFKLAKSRSFAHVIASGKWQPEFLYVASSYIIFQIPLMNH